MTEVRARVERAMAAAEAPAFTFDGFMGRRERHRRRQRLAAGVVALAVFLVPLIIFANGGLDRSTAVDTPAPVDEPSVVPTDTVIDYGKGDLVVSMTARPGVNRWPNDMQPVSQVWIYGDGQVIVRHELGCCRPALPGEPQDWDVTPLLGSRLSPEGLELVRSELLVSGLFETDTNFSAASAITPLGWGSMYFDDGTSATTIGWGGGSRVDAEPGFLSDRQRDELVRISSGLADMEAWLPPEAWDDGSAEAHIYTPAAYAICFWEGDRAYGAPLERPVVPDVLPVDARRILVNSWQTFDLGWSEPRCAVLPYDDAVNLETILSDAGATPLGPGDAGTMSGGYLIGSDELGEVVASFEPILPHGTWEVMGG